MAVPKHDTTSVSPLHFCFDTGCRRTTNRVKDTVITATTALLRAEIGTVIDRDRDVVILRRGTRCQVVFPGVPVSEAQRRHLTQRIAVYLLAERELARQYDKDSIAALSRSCVQTFSETMIMNSTTRPSRSSCQRTSLVVCLMAITRVWQPSLAT